MRNFSILALFIVVCLSAGAGCGGIALGPATAPRDPVPVGTVVANGEFVGLNGQTVSGVASVYKLTETGAFIVRLEGITTPSEAALYVRAETNDGRVLNTYLRATTGTQNYVTTAAGNPTWVSVSIYSTITALDYGKATLIQIAP